MDQDDLLDAIKAALEDSYVFSDATITYGPGCTLAVEWADGLGFVITVERP